MQKLGNVGEFIGKLLPCAFMPILIPIKLAKLGIETLGRVFRHFGLNVKSIFGALKSIFMNFTPLGWMLKGFLALKSFVSGFSLEASGKKIIHTLVAGIKSVALAPYHAIKSIFAKVRKLLPFSDAKEGPLSQLTRSGESIVNTLAKGALAQKDALKLALANVLKLPTIKALTIPARFTIDKLVKPAFGALTAPVKFTMQSSFPMPALATAHGNINVNLTQHFSVNGSLDNKAVETIGKTTEDAIRRVIERYFYEKERVSF